MVMYDDICTVEDELSSFPGMSETCRTASRVSYTSGSARRYRLLDTESRFDEC